MSEDKESKKSIPWWIGIVVAAIIGVALVGVKTSQQNDQNRIDNLPALEIKVESLEKAVENFANQIDNLKEDVNQRDDLFQEQIDRRIERELQGQIDRRFEALQRESDLLRNELREMRSIVDDMRPER